MVTDSRNNCHSMVSQEATGTRLSVFETRLTSCASTVGSSCAGRAQVYHELHHWGFTTHERMTNKLESIRTVFPDAVNVRDAKSRCERKRLEDEQVERDRREADRCATILDGEGTISEVSDGSKFDTGDVGTTS